MSEETMGLRKNPSRKECEKIIRKILMTEVLERGESISRRHKSWD